MPEEKNSKLLSDLIVIDLTRVLSGPFCTRMLSDLGARVIKVESGSGDHTRLTPPLKGGYSHYFSQFNAGKKSLGLNLRHPQGLELIKKLIKLADVVVENFRPGVMKRMGLDYPVLKKIKPAIILCSISGFGQTGPEVHRLAFTDNIQAYSGMDFIAGKMMGPDADPPGFPYSFGDTYASLNAAVGILAALRHRDRTGEGQWIDIAMLDCVLAANDSSLQKCVFSGGTQEIPGIAFRAPLRLKDGHLAAALAWHFERVARAIGRPEILEEERFKTVAARSKWENFNEFLKIVREWARDKTIAEASETFEKFEVSYGKVNTIAEIVTSPIVKEREMLVEMDLPGNGPVKLVNTPFKFSGKAVRPPSPPPRLGEHNEEVLAEMLGMSKTEIEALTGEGILTRG